jgi:hypothetical protein
MDEYLKTDNIARAIRLLPAPKPIRHDGHRVGGKIEI